METAAVVGAAGTAARAAEVSRVGVLAAVAVAPRPQSPGGGRTGCARATSIASVTAQTDLPGVWREGSLHNQVQKKTENAGMAVDMPGKTSTGDHSPVCCEAEVEAYITLDIKRGECLVSMMRRGKYGRWGTICGFLTQGQLITSRMILDHSRIMLNAVGCYVVREVTRSWGPVLFVFPFDLGRGWSA